MSAARTCLLVAVALTLLPSIACASSASGKAEGEPALRLGYFANLTHAVPLVGIADGTFASEMDGVAELQPELFNAGPSVIEALFAGEIDAAYIGPNPAINGYVRSKGEAVRVIAGAATGGAALVVRPGAAIAKPADFDGKTVATPQLANTQDVALRAWLDTHGLAAREDGGDVNVLPMSSGDAFAQFRNGTIDAAWMPEPWVSRLIVEAGAEVFVDEHDLWPGGEFATTLLIVRPRYQERHPEAVAALLRAHVATISWIDEHPGQSMVITNDEIKRLTSYALPVAVIERAWDTLEFTYDPAERSLETSARHAFELGFLGTKDPDLSGMLDLGPLNAELSEAGLAPVGGAG